MLSKVQARLTYANVISTIALFGVLAGGGAYAASKIGSHNIKRNAVRSRHIKNGQVRTQDVANDSLTGADIDESSLTGFGSGAVLSRIEDLGGAGTAYGTPAGVAPAHSSEPPVEMILPAVYVPQLKATQLHVVLSDSLSEPPGTSQTFTLRSNGNDTALSCTIEGAGVSGCNSPSNTVVNLGSLILIKIVSTGTPIATVDALVGFRVVQ
jgi:hypothetical protein